MYHTFEISINSLRLFLRTPFDSFANDTKIAILFTSVYIFISILYIYKIE